MRFLVDECCDAKLVDHLRKESHDVLYVTEYSPASSDSEVLEKAFSENRILITEDKDFGELIFRLKLKTIGVILLRFSIEEREFKWQGLKQLIEIKGPDLEGKFIVVDKEKIRILEL